VGQAPPFSGILSRRLVSPPNRLSHSITKQYRKITLPREGTAGEILGLVVRNPGTVWKRCEDVTLKIVRVSKATHCVLVQSRCPNANANIPDAVPGRSRTWSLVGLYLIFHYLGVSHSWKGSSSWSLHIEERVGCTFSRGAERSTFVTNRGGCRSNGGQEVAFALCDAPP
jgi:hypothetical protein